MEKYSSASTLSDMEIFVFPELLYSLVLANILSPRLWAWRDDPWFRKMDKLTPYRRVLRLKQYIIDHYEFNLDLDTWGLTRQEREMERFRPFLDEKIISESNALFGYEGDKYYFDLDIRRHFGLEKYTRDTIPYWKTETLEAMDAFRFRPGYRAGAGECVSLSTLYAAALFVVCGIPLDDIFLLATPLHSQNFVLVRDGILTNNRRIVSKRMWFNGTELTAKAQRALRHEQVTIIAHHSGWLHVAYPEASLDQDALARFQNALKDFLRTPLDAEVLLAFLRQERDLQTCFQICCERPGRPRYLPMERMFHYEQSSAHTAHADTRERLLSEIDEYEYFSEPMADRLCFNRVEEALGGRVIQSDDADGLRALAVEFRCHYQQADKIMERLRQFVHITPRLPGTDKQWRAPRPLAIAPEQSREEIRAYLEGIRAEHPVADLAFYPARDLARTEWAPFLKAALERNPVAIAGAQDLDEAALRAHLDALPNESIYDDTRAAQPDEVWNFGRGDGLERALCLANILHARQPERPLTLECADGQAILRDDREVIAAWPGAKGFQRVIALTP
ncbi:MAG: hypothetical protein K9N49_01490 [Candidatus Marinimicrobia bacterium]|nr:hypothetical protein [Candidatus Neomarinimicrobiota bacterium]